MSYPIIPTVDSATKLFPQPTVDALLTALGITDLTQLTTEQSAAIAALNEAVAGIGYPA